MRDRVVIEGRAIGDGNPPYVIAELSANHSGSLERALHILEAAHAAGASAVKLQTYTADSITIDVSGGLFDITSGPWAGRTLHDLYGEGSMPWEWHEPLFRRGRELGITVFSSPFDDTAVDLLEELDAPAYKIASPEVVDLGLIERVARTGRPMIMSTGMATLAEIDEAVATARGAGCEELVLLHCVSAYPAPADEASLLTIAHLRAAFGVPVGLSDHTLGTAVSIAAVSVGAAVLERHVTLRRSDGGIDAAFSLEPEELAALVRDVGLAQAALGDVAYGPRASEVASLPFRRSLFVVRDVPAGAVLTKDDVRSIRPSGGLHPRALPEVLGSRATRALRRGEPLERSMFEPSPPQP